jgi:hypothetical protein
MNLNRIVMPQKIAIKKVSPKSEKMVLLHDCTKEDVIDSLDKKVDILSIILTGNGDPEKGIARKVAIIGERQTEVLKKLGEVHESLTEYHKETEEAKGVAVTTQHALEDYKLEINTADQTREKERQERRSRLLKNIEVIGVVIAALGLIVTAYFSAFGSQQSKQNAVEIQTTKEKIEDLGTPVITNSRGELVELPKGDSIKYFGVKGYKDFKDTTK